MAALNTLLVVALASVLSTLIALCIAFGRLAPPALVRGASSLYVEVFRNIPLLLQILFWYFSAIACCPGVEPTSLATRCSAAIAAEQPAGLCSCPAARTLVHGRSLCAAVHGPRSHVRTDGFDVGGGFAMLPELMALTLGLSIYNSTFLAEIFRAGILSVPRGQIEAAATVGLSGVRAALLITLPQALRVALPAAGGQYQTLAKASSLAAAIGYPDIMQIVGGTVASQTSQALEAMTLVVLLYAAINLFIALVVGLANRRLLMREGR